MEAIEQVKAETLPIPTQAKMIIVRDEGSLRQANDFFNIIRALRKKIASVFDPMEEAAKEAKRKAEDSRKAIVEQREKIEAPLKDAESYLGGQVVDYKKEQDRKREEEIGLQRQKAIKEEMERRKKEEEARIEQAAALEAAGAQEEAQALVDEVIEDIGRPVEVYVPPPETQKVKLDGATVKTFWSAKVTNKMKLIKAVAEGKAPEGCLDPNMTVLNGLARSLKKEMKIEGVEAVPTSSMSSTGRRAA